MTAFFFAPHVLPAYSYDPSKNDIVDETPLVKDVFKALLMTIVWGAMLSVFLYPVHIGVTVLSIAILTTVGLFVAAAAHVPSALGRSVGMLGVDMVQEAAHATETKPW